jgi:hypothetical protein
MRCSLNVPARSSRCALARQGGRRMAFGLIELSAAAVNEDIR